MDRLSQVCAWALLLCPLVANAEDVIYITTSNSGILKADSGGWSTFAPTNGYHELIPGPGGDFYAVRSNRVVRLDSSGGTSVFASGVMTNSYGMALDPQGNLLIGNRSDDSIQQVDRSGVTSLWSSSPALNGPFDLEFDSAGNLYVSNIDGNNVLRKSQGGEFSVFASELSLPMGMAFDASGNLFVVCNGSNTIAKITPAGTVSVFASTLPVTNPWDVAFDSAGSLYLVSYWDDRVLKFDPGGQSSLFATLPSNSTPYFITIVPEPTAMSLLGLGGLVLIRRRTRWVIRRRINWEMSGKEH